MLPCKLPSLQQGVRDGIGQWGRHRRLVPRVSMFPWATRQVRTWKEALSWGLGQDSNDVIGQLSWLSNYAPLQDYATNNESIR